MQERLLPPISSDLISRVLRVDAAYTISRMEVIREQPGHAIEVEYRTQGDIVALMAKGLSSPSFNRVIGLSRGDEREIAPLHLWYAGRQVKPRFELLPDRYDAALGGELKRLGYFQSGFHSSVYTVPSDCPQPTERVQIRTVDEAVHLETFLDVYLQGWTMPAVVHDAAKNNMRNWINRPNWSLYLGLLDGRPAGMAIMFIQDGIAYLADIATIPDCRGRGVQAALLRHQCAAAAAAKAEIVYSQATFCETSFRNMQRIGMRLLHTHSLWTQQDVAPSQEVAANGSAN